MLVIVNMMDDVTPNRIAERAMFIHIRIGDEKGKPSFVFISVLTLISHQPLDYRIGELRHLALRPRSAAAHGPFEKYSVE